MERKIQHHLDYVTLKTGGKSGFSVPKNYFETVESNIFTKIKKSKNTKDKHFNIPENYFIELEDKIIAKVYDKPTINLKKETKIISLQQKVRKAIAYASAACIVLFVGIYFVNNYQLSSISIDEITAEEIENWYNNGYGDTDEIALVTTLNDTDFSDEELLPINTNEDNLEDYLNLNDSSIFIDEIQ